MTTGDRVCRTTRTGLRVCGRVSFVRSGFATVRWDDGSETVEWAAELEAAPR